MKEIKVKGRESVGKMKGKRQRWKGGEKGERKEADAKETWQIWCVGGRISWWNIDNWQYKPYSSSLWQHQTISFHWPSWLGQQAVHARTSEVWAPGSGWRPSSLCHLACSCLRACLSILRRRTKSPLALAQQKCDPSWKFRAIDLPLRTIHLETHPFVLDKLEYCGRGKTTVEKGSRIFLTRPYTRLPLSRAVGQGQ